MSNDITNQLALALGSLMGTIARVLEDEECLDWLAVRGIPQFKLEEIQDLARTISATFYDRRDR